MKKGSNQEDIACSTIIPYVYRYTTLNDNIKTTTAEIAMKMCLYVLITTLGVMNDAKYKKGLENECSIMGDVLFLTKKEVVVVKVYTLFRLVVVHYPDETEEFCVDICALSRKPDCTNSITLNLIRGKVS